MLIPISALLASPGPLTGQPITATVISFLILLSSGSSSSTIGMIFILVLAHVGHETRLIESLRMPKALRIFLAAITSSSGSDVSDTRIVSPIPSLRSVPMAIDDLTIPTDGEPASVSPR